MMSPTVSVIIPTHNRKVYLQEAVDSILAQTYTDYEIIVVENGCAPEAECIVADLGDPRVRYAYSPEPNRSLARNLGAQISHGRYLAFLDDDDRFLPTYLERQVSFLENNLSIGLVGCGAFLVDETGQRFGEWRLWELSPKLDLVSCFPGCYLMPTATVIRHPWYERAGGQDPALPPAEDTDLFLRLMLAGCKMAWQKELLCEYRVHLGSSQKDAATYAASREKMLERLLADPRMPASLVAEADRFRLACAETAAGQCYAAAQIESAREYLEHSTALARKLGRTDVTQEILDVALGACNKWEVPDPHSTAQRALRLIGQDVPVDGSRRKLSLARAAMMGFYRGWEQRQPRMVLRGFVGAAWRKPSFLLNIGTWSILLRSLWRLIVRGARQETELQEAR